MQYDVIIVGAGPAGSTAARECATGGLSVLLLDRAEFPRDKPCGGGVTFAAARLLPFDLDPVVERVATGVNVTVRRKHGFARDNGKVHTYLTQRSRFDTFLMEKAIEAGAEFHQREQVKEIERTPDKVTVRTNEGIYTGRLLIAADGANGTTARLAGVDMGFVHGVAYEGNVTTSDGVPDQWKAAVGLDFGAYPGGYAWVFPKEDHLNIGIGGWRFTGPTLRKKFSSMVKSYGFDPDDMWGIRGYRLPMRHNDAPLLDGNLLLVGDAAGLIDPLTGEGIYSAIWSGKTAADTIFSYVQGEAPDLEGYRHSVETERLPELRVSRQLHDIFHLWPGLFVGVERRTSVLWGPVLAMLRGDRYYVNVPMKMGKLWSVAEFISDLMRVNPLVRRFVGLKDPIPPERFFRGNTGRQSANT